MRWRAVGLVLVLAACSGGDGGPVAAARDIVDDDGRFTTAYDAGEALANVGGRLLDAGRDCDCPALLSAAAFAQVLAVRVLDCTAPGRFEVRAAMRAYLDDIEDLPDDAPAPQPPRPPACHQP